MGRMSKLSFLKAGRKTGNEATTNGHTSSQGSTYRPEISPFSAGKDSDDTSGQVSSPTSSNIQTSASRSPLSPRTLPLDEANALRTNRMSQSEVHLPRPSCTEQLPCLETLDRVIEQSWNENGPSDKLKRMRCQDSTSTLDSQLDANLYHTAIAQGVQSPSSSKRNLRRGLPSASTPNLRASCIISEDEVEKVPELPSFNTSKPVKPGRTGLVRLLSKTVSDLHETTIPVRRASDMPLKAYPNDLRQSRSSDLKPRHPSIMKLPSHETFFRAKPKTKPKSSELELTNTHEQSEPFENTKIHVRKPRPGARHWFDAFDSDSDDKSDQKDNSLTRNDGSFGWTSTERKDSQSSQMQPMPSPLSVPSSKRTNQEEHWPASRKESVSQHSSIRKDSLSMDEAGPTLGNAFADAKRGQFDRSMSVQPRESRFYGTNLLNQSILSLSSDDDDDNDSFSRKDLIDIVKDERSRRNAPLRRRGTKALASKSAISADQKISSSRYSDDCTISKNDNLIQGDNNNKLRTRSTGPSNLSSLYQNDYGRSRSYTRQYSRIEEEEGTVEASSKNAAKAEGTDQPWLTSPTTRAASHTGTDEGFGPRPEVKASASDHKSAISEPTTHVEHRRLIEVTEEEEALLKLMRNKRAITPKRSFTKGHLSTIDMGGDQNIRQPKKKISVTEKPRTSAFLTLDSPICAIFPNPPGLRHSVQAPPLPRLPNAAAKAAPLASCGPPTEFPKRTSSITPNTSPFTLTRTRSYDTLPHISHTESLPGSTTASTIMPSDSVSAHGYAPPAKPSILPPLPDLSNISSQLALSQALAYDSNDMFPSPTTAPISSPSTPVFQSTAANSATGIVEIVGADSDLIADALASNTGRTRGETMSSGSVIALDKDDAFSTITAGSKSIMEITRSNKATMPSARRSRQVSDPARVMSRPSSSKSSLPYGRTSIGDDVLSAWKALGGMRNVGPVPVGNCT